MWEPVKSAPWSLYNVDGSPHTGHCGSLLRHTACRNANAVCAAVGASRNTVYPATAREWSSSTTVNHGRAGLARSSSTITVGSPGGIAPPGSHGTERDSLPSLRSSHRILQKALVHAQCLNRPGSRATRAVHQAWKRLKLRNRLYFF